MSVESLLEERRGYVLRGLTDRVAQVDAELAALGYAVEADEKPKRGRKSAPEVEAD